MISALASKNKEGRKTPTRMAQCAGRRAGLRFFCPKLIEFKSFYFK